MHACLTPASRVRHKFTALMFWAKVGMLHSVTKYIACATESAVACLSGLSCSYARLACESRNSFDNSFDTGSLKPW